MFKDFLKDNEENAISFVTIAIVIICIIVIVIIFAINFLGNNKDNIIINQISYSNYIESTTGEYEEILKNLLNIRNTDELFKKIDPSYIAKNKLSEDNFKKFMLDNNYIGNSIAIVSNDVFQQDGIYVFRYYYKNYSNYKYVNVIEAKPGEYLLSFDQNIKDININDVSYTGSIDNIVFELSLLEKSEESIKFSVKVLNESEYDIFVDFNDINTFSLIDNNGKTYGLSGVVAQDIGVIQPGSFVSRELYFNINSEEFKNCIGVQVLNIEINGEYKDLIIKF